MHTCLKKNKPIIFDPHTCPHTVPFLGFSSQQNIWKPFCTQLLPATPQLLQFLTRLQSGFHSHFTEIAIFKCPFVSKYNCSSLSLSYLTSEAVFHVRDLPFLPESNFFSQHYWPHTPPHFLAIFLSPTYEFSIMGLLYSASERGSVPGPSLEILPSP